MPQHLTLTYPDRLPRIRVSLTPQSIKRIPNFLLILQSQVERHSPCLSETILDSRSGVVIVESGLNNKDPFGIMLKTPPAQIIVTLKPVG
jgi:hypothetical protein